MSLDITLSAVRRTEVYSTNITHNLGRMAAQAGIYDCLWDAQETGFKTAFDITARLETGIHYLKSNPEQFKQYNATNGWGTYDQFVPWLEELLEACKANPDAEINISR